MGSQENDYDVTNFIIPGEVAFNPSLTNKDQHVFWIIQGLDSTEKHCYAGNDYFACILATSRQTISNSIRKLKQQKYIKQLSFDGRKRVLMVDLNYLKLHHHHVEAFNERFNRPMY